MIGGDVNTASDAFDEAGLEQPRELNAVDAVVGELARSDQPLSADNAQGLQLKGGSEASSCRQCYVM